MKSLVVFCCLVLGAYCASFFNQELDDAWALFKRTHKKTYGNIAEEISRRLIWEKNVEKIRLHNLETDMGLHTYTLGMNRFGDLTNQEFRKQMNGFRMPTEAELLQQKREMFVAPASVVVPDSVDWRKEGYVTEVKDQGQCGSCWAFSATGSLEGQTFAKTKVLPLISEQQLVDCSDKFGNIGCDGGLMPAAFEYIKQNNGIDSEKSYPYEAVDGKCRFKPENIVANDAGYAFIRSKNETDLTLAIATVGPIAIAIDASQDSFQLYSGGIYNEPMCSQTDLDHGVLAVGYGSDGGKHPTDYYIVKNSWGSGWGDDGYIMMLRNSNNQCGVATMASYPLL